jgi:RNA polymerase sigma-70 factor, ECF subfamily
MEESRPQAVATFEELAVPLFDQLYNFARWMTGNDSEAEDLVQETYAKGLRGFESFRAGTNFRAWMYRILRNSYLSSRTGLKASVAFDEEDPGLPQPADSATPEDHVILESDRQAVQRALESLPPHFREVLLLCDVEEMTYQEIAATLGVPAGTVMSRLFRARQTLRRLLQQSPGTSS